MGWRNLDLKVNTFYPFGYRFLEQMDIYYPLFIRLHSLKGGPSGRHPKQIMGY